MSHINNSVRTLPRPGGCRVVLPSPVSTFSRRFRNSASHASYSGSANPTFHTSLANSGDVSPIPPSMASPFATPGDVLSWGTISEPTHKKTVSTLHPKPPMLGNAKNSRATSFATHRRSVTMTEGIVKGSGEVPRAAAPMTLEERVTAAKETAHAEENAKAEEREQEEEKTPTQLPPSNAGRIRAVERQLHENGKLLRWLTMSESRQQKTVPNLFPYREEILRLKQNSQRWPKPVAEHNMISAMVKLEMKKLSIRSPQSLRNSRSADKFQEHMAESNLSFLLGLVPPAKGPQRNRGRLLHPASFSQPRRVEHMASRSVCGPFLTSLNFSAATPMPGKLPELSRTGGRDSKMTLERIVGKYNEINAKCEGAERESEKRLQDYEEAMRACGKKVEEIMGERLLIHIRKEKRPSALVELQRRASASS